MEPDWEMQKSFRHAAGIHECVNTRIGPKRNATTRTMPGAVRTNHA
jgi:hypothetical protein